MHIKSIDEFIQKNRLDELESYSKPTIPTGGEVIENKFLDEINRYYRLSVETNRLISVVAYKSNDWKITSKDPKKTLLAPRLVPINDNHRIPRDITKLLIQIRPNNRYFHPYNLFAVKKILDDPRCSKDCTIFGSTKNKQIGKLGI